MILYGSTASPFVRHARIALMQSGFDFVFEEVDYDRSAEMSPTAKVPYLTDGELMLTDSSSILKYVREKSGAPFLADIVDFERFTLASTLVDTAINLFLMEKEGLTSDRVPYLGRQERRLSSGLDELNRRIDPADGIRLDSALRCACFIDWAMFRDRFSLAGRDNLTALVEIARRDTAFSGTDPR
jgi:glutathione S-transferase